MPAPPLDGTILVTGASSGLGAEFARQLAAEAKALVLVARRRDRLDALAAELVGRRSELTVRVETCDLARVDEAEALLRRLDADGVVVDVLINNAGFGDIGLLETSEWPKLEQMIRVNVLAPTFLAWSLYPRMRARGRGGILDVSSGFGLAFLPGLATYVGTKHYLTSFTECLRLEATGTGVVVSQVCPGEVRTEFGDVAGNRLGMGLPEIFKIEAGPCVRDALRGFRRGRALVIPSLRMKLMMGLVACVPRWLQRAAVAAFVRVVRPRLGPP